MKTFLKKKWENLIELFSQDESSSNEKVNSRRNLVFVLLGTLFVVEIANLFYNSAVIKGLNPKADAYREAAVRDADAATIIPGNIYDRNGRVLVNNTQPTEYTAEYADDYAYFQILGYLGGKRLENGGFEDSTDKISYRLMQHRKDDLYDCGDNVLNDKGCDITVTLDHSLQMKVQEALLEELLKTNGMQANVFPNLNRGSAVVLDAKTGEILSMVAFPTLNANDLEKSVDSQNKMNADVEIFYPLTHKGGIVPGSIFKIITTCSLLDHGLENFYTIDEPFEVDSAPIVNFDNQYTYGEMGYQQGLKRSSNVFFAQAALELGEEALSETAKKFYLGTEAYEYDFGKISSENAYNKEWNLTSSTMGEAELLAKQGFGQGTSRLTSLKVAMIIQAIANDGVMMEPYMIKSVVYQNGKVKETGTEKILSKATSKETADKVTDAMVATVQHYIETSSKITNKNKEILRKYSVAGKTGTGEETGKDGKNINNSWFVSFAPGNQDPEYVVVVNQSKTDKYGINMVNVAAEIYQYLFENQ